MCSNGKDVLINDICQFKFTSCSVKTGEVWKVRTHDYACLVVKCLQGFFVWITGAQKQSQSSQKYLKKELTLFITHNNNNTHHIKVIFLMNNMEIKKFNELPTSTSKHLEK